MTIAAVVTAAGYGTRLGSTLPKALVPVAGRPLVTWAVESMAEIADAVVVTAPPTHVDEVAGAVEGIADAVSVVAGGDDRQESVSRGLAALESVAQPTVILVHDAARAFQPTRVARAGIAAVLAGAAGAVPTVPVIDTLVTASAPRATEAALPHTLGDVVDRSALRAVQTPQVFDATALHEAHRAHAGLAATDDAQLVRALGGNVVTVAGDPAGFKVTTPWDLVLADHAARAQLRGKEGS